MSIGTFVSRQGQTTAELPRRVVSFCPQYPGTTRVLRELEKLKLSSHVELVPDQNVAYPLGSVAILGAWHPIYNSLIPFLREKGYEKICVLWTSPVAQSEYSPVEFQYLASIKRHLETRTLNFIWLGSKDWIKADIFPMDSAFYMPYPITLRAPSRRMFKVPKELHISLFGPLNGRKNVATQMIAAKKLDAQLHVNSLTDEYASLADLLGVRIVKDTWLPTDLYYDHLEQMHLGFQVSQYGVESFSYVALDHYMMGVPCLHNTDWFPSELHCEPEVDDIVTMARQAIEFGSQNEWKWDFTFLPKLAEEHNSQVKEGIKALLET